MSSGLASSLKDFFEDRTNGGLRSIVAYERDGFEIEYLREDVAAHYTDHQLAKAIGETRFETISAPIYERVFADDHGGLTCMVNCFENVMEMNFVLADEVGVAVGLDMAALEEAGGLVSEARQILVQERGES